jgi:hypothetical protein
MFSQNCNPKPKPPFYYIAHPHEAYTRGHTIYLGTANQQNQEYQAYNYFLPMEAARLIPVINDYFHTLIKESETRLHADRMRRKSFLCSIDTTIATLCRLDFLSKRGLTLSIGSRHLKPVTWAVFGKDEPLMRCYKHWWHHIYALINHYTKRYEGQCHCVPVCLYHGQQGRQMLTELMKGAPQKGFTANIVMTAAVQFFADIIEHGGPDMEEFFDLFTNDMTTNPDDVDLQIWQRARDQALNGVGTQKFPERKMGFQYPASTSYAPQPPPKPMRVKVVITEDKDDTITTPFAKVTKFKAIQPQKAGHDPDDYSGHWAGGMGGWGGCS